MFFPSYLSRDTLTRLFSASSDRLKGRKLILVKSFFRRPDETNTKNERRSCRNGLIRGHPESFSCTRRRFFAQRVHTKHFQCRKIYDFSSHPISSPIVCLVSNGSNCRKWSFIKSFSNLSLSSINRMQFSSPQASQRLINVFRNASLNQQQHQLPIRIRIYLSGTETFFLLSTLNFKKHIGAAIRRRVRSCCVFFSLLCPCITRSRAAEVLREMIGRK